MKSEPIVLADVIEHHIYIIRDQRVMLDEDLAKLYGVATKALNRAVDRNIEKFPEDFSFRLTKEEWSILKSQLAASNLKYQIGTSSLWGGRRKTPRVFTEHGAYASAFVLRSPRAQQMSIEVIRAFIRIRNFLASQEGLTKNVNALKSFVLKHSQKTDQEFRRVWKAIEKLTPPPQEERRIGFRLD